MSRILVDGDACPVKSEIYRLALRHDRKVLVVSSGPLRMPAHGRIEHVRVRPGFDAADDRIVAETVASDVVVTADIRLAARCLRRGAFVLAPDGTVFDEDSIGEAEAGRALLDELRQMGLPTEKPRPFAAADRAKFCRELSRAIEARRSQARP